MVLRLFAGVLTLAACASATPAAAPASSSTPRVVRSLSPAQRLDQAVRAALGRGDRDVPRVSRVALERDHSVTVDWAINDAITTGLTKKFARRDILAILRAVRDAKVPVSVVLVRGTYSMQNVYGRVSEDRVITARYAADTMRRIDYDNFDDSKVFVVADTAQVVPAFRP